MQEEDCQADLDTWNKRFLKMLKDEKKEENTKKKSPRPVFNLRDLDQKGQMERERRQRQNLAEIKSNSYNNLYGKLI